MQTLISRIRMMVWNIINRPSLVDLCDILLMAFLIYSLLKLTRETRASAVLKGLALLFIASFFADLLGLTSLNWLLSLIIKNGAVALVVIFQPELRKALEQIGSGKLNLAYDRDEDKAQHIIEELTTCLLDLSRRRVGALIVLEQKIGLKDVVETGTALHSEISAALLENIFEPNTPLHDGAVVIRDDKILAAACILPLTEGKGISRDLGTRHRAALGITETTDAVVLIVSEETGIISMANEHRITRYLDKKAIEKLLGDLYLPENSSLFTSLIEKIKTRKGGDAA